MSQEEKDQLWSRIMELSGIEDTMRALINTKRAKDPNANVSDMEEEMGRVHSEVLSLMEKYNSL